MSSQNDVTMTPSWRQLPAATAAMKLTVALTIISGVHYVLRLALDLRHSGRAESETAKS